LTTFPDMGRRTLSYHRLYESGSLISSQARCHMLHLMTSNNPLSSHHDFRHGVAHQSSLSNGASKLLRTIMHPVACLLFKFFRLLIVVICTTLDCLAGPYAAVECLGSVIFEVSSDVCGIRACGTYGPQKSAILILGAQEGASHRTQYVEL
jgi:hypothetical protein